MDIHINISLNGVSDDADIERITERLRTIAESITNQPTRAYVHDRHAPGRYDRLTLLKSLNRTIGVTGDNIGFDDNSDRIILMRE